MQPHHRAMSVNGAAVKDSNDLRNDVGQMTPGSTVKLTVVRDGKEQTYDVKLTERQTAGSVDEERNAPGGRSGAFGMLVVRRAFQQHWKLAVRPGTIDVGPKRDTVPHLDRHAGFEGDGVLVDGNR